MTPPRSNATIVCWLLLAVFLWGGNNVGVKHLVATWPPVWVGATRFLAAGVLLLAAQRWLLGPGYAPPLSREQRRWLWRRTGLSLAAYIVAFNAALTLTAASHVALYLAASPVWALLLERRSGQPQQARRAYVAAGLALLGVLVLMAPKVHAAGTHWVGEALGLAGSILWAFHGLQVRSGAAHLSGARITAHTMWRASVWLSPLGLAEWWRHDVPWRWDLAAIQAYCILAGGVVAFALWNGALAHWPASRVFLFNNLIPVSTMTWAHFCLGEALGSTFFLAMALIGGAVLLARIPGADRALLRKSPGFGARP